MKIRYVLSIWIVMMLMVANAGAIGIERQKLFGNVSIDGLSAKDGTIIKAVIGSTEYAHTSTIGGRYGYDVSSLFYVPGDQGAAIDDGTTVKLYVNGTYAKEFPFASKAQTQLDLSVTTGSTGSTGTPVVTFNKPSGDPSVNQTDDPEIPPPMPQTNAIVQSTPDVSQAVPVQTASAPVKEDIAPTKASAIDGVLSIITLLFAGIILRTIRRK